MNSKQRAARLGVLKRILREIREERNITQIELAERLHTSQSYISKVERGEKRLDLAELEEFANAIGISFIEMVEIFHRTK